MTATTPDTYAGDLDVESVFWEARPELAAVRQTARAALASPWAVLGCVLARVALSVPPSVVIPPLGNDRSAVASLNVFVGLVGPSGVGKGVATRAAEDFLDIQPGAGRLIVEVPLGSGEGISHMFIHTDSEGEETPAIHSVWFDVPEIDTLTALIGRKASTLASEVRKMFSGRDWASRTPTRPAARSCPATPTGPPSWRVSSRARLDHCSTTRRAVRLSGSCGCPPPTPARRTSHLTPPRRWPGPAPCWPPSTAARR
nr:hypothetical protein GCM10025730_36040 [Promicromonospora thailandica]